MSERMRLWRFGALLGCGVALVACGGASGAIGSSSIGNAPGQSDPRAVAAATGPVPAGDWPTFDFDAQRSGVDPAGTGIVAGNVAGLSRRVVHVDGTVDSAPIELHGIVVGGRARDVIFVTTTYGRTIAIDPGTGGRLWEFVPSDIRSYQGSSQVTTATPVADPSRAYIYAASPNGMIHKLSVATGREVRSPNWPVRVTFDPTTEKLAGALNISGSSLIVVTGGYYGDAPSYQGHLVLIDRVSGRITHVFNTLCSNRTAIINPPRACHSSDSAIWARAGAVVEPDSGRLLIATGNGPFNGRTNWGDSVLELSPTAQLLHSWTPTNQQELNDNDTDIGSSAPAVLPSVGGRRLAVQGAKDGLLHVLDLSRLNGTAGGAGPKLGGEVQNVDSPGSTEVFTAPVVWSHNGRVYVFVADNGGTAAYVAHGGAHPGLTVAWRNSDPGTSPVLAGGLLYAFDLYSGVMNVYNPASGARIASLAAGGGGHWNSPIVVGGRIVEPLGSYFDQSTRGAIVIWHLPGR